MQFGFHLRTFRSSEKSLESTQILVGHLAKNILPPFLQVRRLGRAPSSENQWENLRRSADAPLRTRRIVRRPLENSSNGPENLKNAGIMRKYGVSAIPNDTADSPNELSATPNESADAPNVLTETPNDPAIGSDKPAEMPNGVAVALF
jgi:hypothetical protein